MTAFFLAVLHPNIKLQFQTYIKVYHSVLSILLSIISLNYKACKQMQVSVRSKVVSIASLCQQMCSKCYFQFSIQGNPKDYVVVGWDTEKGQQIEAIAIKKLAVDGHPSTGATVRPLIKIEAWLVYFLYTKSIHFLYLTTLVYIFSIHQIYIKQNFVF